ncbi:MAG: pyridoxamine 5'-phosphate oxidase family protein [Pseudomonadota bacterium]
MNDYTLDPNHCVSDETALRALFPPTHDLAARKSIAVLDAHAQTFLGLCPFVCIGTQNTDGTADVSPRGDPAGFIKILDQRTLAIPDRPGNNRLDTLSNIVTNANVGVLCMIPGFDDTMRINGTAQLSTDPDLLAQMAIQDRTPKLAIVVHISEVFMHCAKAFRRSRLWAPDAQRARSEMPSLMKIMLDQTSTAPTDADTMRQLDDALEAGYKTSMY